MTAASIKPKALLSLCWEAPENSIPAKDLTLAKLPESSSSLLIGNCESLFERRPEGYAELKKLERLLPQIAESHPSLKISCHLNAFAYAFLKGAKNYDFLLPEADKSPFRAEEEAFRSHLSQLEKFEQLGDTFPSELDKEVYFALRKIFIRSNAREEKWVLAELLISGPSSLESLIAVLSSYEGPLTRSLSQYHALNVVTMDQTTASLTHKHLPIVYFFVREVMGIDPLELLS